MGQLNRPKIVTATSYRDGAEGFIQWCEDFVCIPIYPVGSDLPVWVPMSELPDTPNDETDKSYKSFWESQKAVFRECLVMIDGKFKYRQIVLCWMRGEGKSFAACLIQLWKFFNWPGQLIMLGANSERQIKFVHFDVMRNFIVNSPKLLEMIGGVKNIQEKEIRLKDKDGIVRSFIRSISTATGIVSNITGYTFSEMFDMKNPRFYTQLDGSIRNIPNALGVIDTTVSTKTHLLYSNIYMGWVSGKTKLVYFSHRFSKKADINDYWNPNMTKDQLSDYKYKFPFGEFEKYFKNVWSAGTVRVFSDEMIQEMGIMGMEGSLLNHDTIKTRLVKRNRIVEAVKSLNKRGVKKTLDTTRVGELEKNFTLVDEFYSLKDRLSNPSYANIEDLQMLTEKFDTYFSILAGMDMADPMSIRKEARSIVVILAKGLPGSRSNPYSFTSTLADPRYVYFILHVGNLSGHSIPDVKKLLDELDTEYRGLDQVCCERYGAWDLSEWCDERDINFDPVYPNYDRQREAFNELFKTFEEGRIKCPEVVIPGSKKGDILREELEIFDHDPDRKWFGSPEKTQRYGIQDDTMYALTWGIYGGRLLGVDDFRIRQTIPFLGQFVPNHDLLGSYS